MTLSPIATVPLAERQPPPPPTAPLSPTAPTRCSAQADGLGGPLLAWLMLQAGALALAASRIPLSANYLRAGERLAVEWVLAAQVVGVAALFPLLLRTWRSTVAAIATAWPFLALAAGLAALPLPRAAAAGVYVTAWLAALGLLRAAVPPGPSAKWHFTAAALATALAAGGAVLWYLASDFAPPGVAAPPADGRFGPLLAAFDLVTPAPHRAADCAWPGGTIAAGLFALLPRLRRLRRAQRRSRDLLET